MRILLIAGGWSSEREVSLAGAKVVAEALAARGHAVTFFDLAHGFDRLTDTAAEHDFAFINLHGAPGEDGLVQALLDTVGCPYQGSDARGSFLALHKAAAKQVFRRAGLLTPAWEFLPAPPPPGWEPALPYPLFAKSNTGGSSLLMARADDRPQLDAILREIFQAGCEALLEPVIEGEDATCGVLGDEALPPILIRPRAGSFFDYKSKYEQGGADELCPAPLPDEINDRMRDAALRAHRALGLEGYSRADFRLAPEGELYLLEVNTLPGMTPNSLMPRETAAVGMDFGDLLERLMELRLVRKTPAQAAPSPPAGSVRRSGASMDRG